MNIRLTDIDSKLPNLALMRLSAHHKALGDTVHYTRDTRPGLFESRYDRVYASAIFTRSRFQRWVVRGYYRFMSFEEYGHEARQTQAGLLGVDG